MGSISMPMSELMGEPLVNDLTVHDILTNAAQANSSSIAIASLHQSPDYFSALSGNDTKIEFAYLQWTFNELLHASHKMAENLAASGIRPGQLIAVYVNSGVEFHIMIRAALELNCPFVPLNPKSATNSRETSHFLEILKPAVIVVLDDLTAEHLDQSVPSELAYCQLLLICNKARPNEKWQDLLDFVKSADKSFELESLKIERKMDDVALVVFTSGTTSLSKGVPHTNRSWSSMLLASVAAYEATPARVNCCTPPLFHLLGVHYSLFYHAVGARVVYPSAVFDAGACLAAIRSELVTDLPAVPAMITALISHPDFVKTDTSCLGCLTLGAANVLPAHLRMCTDDLKVKKVINTFGMTECGAAWAGTPEQVPEDSYPTKGYMIRICNPDTDEILPRGQAGELHIGGNTVVQKYWVSKTQDAKKANSCFYDDKYGHWIKTGDQAVIAENRHISVVGRYKDLIIRGGVNIAPRTIESALTEEFGIMAEVVGIPDSIAGEVPIAVIKGTVAIKAQDIQEVIFRRLGKAFVLEEVILLSDLGKEDFPKTATGKVKKDELRELVIKYLSAQDTEISERDGTVATLTKLWSKMLGTGPITSEMSVHDYADSLLLARFSAKLRQLTGQRLSLQQLLDHPTIKEQAELLLSSQTRNAEDSSVSLIHRDKPLQMTDVSYAMGSSSKFEDVKRLCQELLGPLDLTWDDVDAIVPMQQYMQKLLQRWRPQSNNTRLTWMCRGKSAKQVDIGLKKSLQNHSIMSSMAIKQGNDVLHVIVQPTEVFFSHFIKIVESVPDSKALVDFEYNNLKMDFAADPGPMLRIFIMDIEEEGCAGFVMLGQHSVFDVTSIHLWLEDLDIALTHTETLDRPEPVDHSQVSNRSQAMNHPQTLHHSGMKLTQHVPYQIWAEHYHNLRHSKEAQQSIAWNSKRLLGIGGQRDALFPKQRVPGWFKGNTEGWIDVDTGELGQHRPMLDDFDGVKGLSQTIVLPFATELKSKFGVEVPQILKAALAVVNTRHTKSNVALFGQYQAGRSWPFLPKWQASRMPEAMHVNGPTLQMVALNVAVRQDNSVLNLFRTLQAEQAGINKHCHAPYFDLMAKLNEDDSGAGDVMEEIVRRQVFNWLPAGITKYRNLEEISMLSRTNNGLLWNCTMSKHGVIQVHVTWDSAQLKMIEVEALVEEFGHMCELLAKSENWDKQIGELV